MTSQTAEQEAKDDYSGPEWKTINVYPRTGSFRLAVLREEWDQQTDEQRKQEVFDACIELGWFDIDFEEAAT